MNITVREQPLPGIGKRYEIDLTPTRRLIVVTTRDGGRWIGLNENDADDTSMLQLTREQATMTGALLLGAQFSIDVADDPAFDADMVIVDTVTVPHGASSVGRRPSDVLATAPSSTRVLGIIRDQTPEVVESDRDSPLGAGDQIAIAARADDVKIARRLLTD